MLLPGWTRVDAGIFGKYRLWDGTLVNWQVNVENLFGTRLLLDRRRQQQHHARLAARGARRDPREFLRSRDGKFPGTA